MATIALNKMKSKLTTRNSFTGRAMERMTKEKLQQLFNGDLNYMYWEELYVQRRFHPNKYLKQIREQRREIFEKEKKKHIDKSNSNLINIKEMLEGEEKHDIEIQQRFKTFLSSHNGNKPVLALDIDNTMICVRFFSEEMKIDDIVTYFGEESVTKNNGKILKIRLTLSLEINNNKLIDIFGSERFEYQYWTSYNEEIKKYKKNTFFEYPLNENKSVNFIKCKIRRVEITACLIETYLNDGIGEEIEIDFTEPNDKLNKFEPCLERVGMHPVDFIYEGFLVRCRPNLDEFMEYIADDFDVVLYTSASPVIYKGLIKQLHIFINETLGRDDNDDDPLWIDILYRDDCILKYDDIGGGKPYHQKDLTLFGCHLSRVVMVDNSPIVCRGQEPNLILIRDYFGVDAVDDELMEVYQLLDAITSIQGDIRYFLCGLEIDDDDNNNIKSLDLSTQNSCLNITNLLFDAMKTYYDQQIESIDDNITDINTTMDDMMSDYDEDDIKNETIFGQIPKSKSLSPLEASTILHDLELLNVSGSRTPDIDDIEENKFENIMDDIHDNSIRKNPEFIPPKRSKNDSIVSIRDLKVIKQEKLEKKRKISFDANTNFENKGRNITTPTRKRKKSSILNSMAPRPTSRAILKESKNEDFFMLFLQHLAVNENEGKNGNNHQFILDQQENEIITLQNELNELEIENNEKIKKLDMYSRKEKEYNESMKLIKNEIKCYQDMIEMRDSNKALLQELKSINNNISILNANKGKLQDAINYVIESKIKLIKSSSDEIEHYRVLIKQIANQKLRVSFEY